MVLNSPSVFCLTAAQALLLQPRSPSPGRAASGAQRQSRAPVPGSCDSCHFCSCEHLGAVLQVPGAGARGEKPALLHQRPLATPERERLQKHRPVRGTEAYRQKATSLRTCGALCATAHGRTVPQSQTSPSSPTCILPFWRPKS